MLKSSEPSCGIRMVYLNMRTTHVAELNNKCICDQRICTMLFALFDKIGVHDKNGWHT